MAQTAPPSMTAPPTAPSRADSANFSTRADAFLAWFATLYTDMVAALANVYANAVDCYNNAIAALASQVAALASQNAAAASASAAASSAGAALWVSGNTYALGLCVWSPATRYTYRKITSNVSTNLTVDPSSNATDWALAGTSAPQLIAVSGTTQTAAVNAHYSLENVAATAVTAPPNPAVGDIFWITPCNSLGTNTLVQNAGGGNAKIMGLAEAYTMDNQHANYIWRYLNSTVGWRRM